MMRFWKRLWYDERGTVPYVSVILIYSILVLGAITGLVCVRNQLVQEFGDLAIAFDQLDQSYSVDFKSAGCADFSFQDEPEMSPDFANPNDPNGLPPADIALNVAPKSEGGNPVSNTPGEQ